MQTYLCHPCQCCFFIRFSQLVKKEANLLVSSLPVLFFYQFFSTSEEGSKPDCVILASVVFYQVFSTGEGSKLVKKEANLIVSSLPVLFLFFYQVFSELVKKEANLLVSSLPVLFFYQVFSTSEEGSKPACVILASVVFLLGFLNQ